MNLPIETIRGIPAPPIETMNLAAIQFEIAIRRLNSGRGAPKAKRAGLRPSKRQQMLDEI